MRAPAPARRRPGLSPDVSQAVGRVLAVLVSIALLAGVGTVTHHGEDRWASSWDPRIEPLARYVERERGHVFRHAVHVDLLADDAFRDEATDEADAARDPDDSSTAMLRAFGLVDGSLDVRETASRMTGDAALAFYDWNTKRITVRGTELDAPTRVTLVHELVHALQDQLFDLGARQADLDDDQMDTFQAVVEGDAERVAIAYYRDVLDEHEQAAVDEDSTPENVADVYGSYPEALVSLFTAPYALGEPATELLAHFGGTNAVDAALRDAPHGAGFLLSPFPYLGDPGTVTVDPPEPAADEEVRDEGTLGTLFWYLALEARLGPVDALHAADAIAGDAYVTVTRGEVVCVRADVVAKAGDAGAAFGRAAQAWAAAMPAGAVHVTQDAAVHVEACDTGASATSRPRVDAAHDALALPRARLSIARLIAEDGATAAFTACAAERFATLTPLDVLLSDDADARPPDAAYDAIRRDCPAR